MTDKVKITLTLSIGFPTATHKTSFEVDREEWEEMSEDDRDQLIEEECQALINNYADVSVKIEEWRMNKEGYVVFGKKNCAGCDQAKALLDSKGLGYQYIDVMTAPSAQQLFR